MSLHCMHLKFTRIEEIRKVKKNKKITTSATKIESIFWFTRLYWRFAKGRTSTVKYQIFFLISDDLH